MPPAAKKVLLRKAGHRRLVSAISVGAVAILLPVVALNVSGSLEGREPAQAVQSNASPSTTSPIAELSMPSLDGEPTPEAVRIMQSLDVTPVIRYERGPQPGVVLATRPLAGEALRSFAVLVVVSDVTSGGPDTNGFVDVGRIVEANHSAFVGVYLDARGTLRVVFDPEARLEDWADELEIAAQGRPLQYDRCPVPYSALNEVLIAVGRRDWASDAASVALEAEIDPATCSVRLTTQELRPSDLIQLSNLYGGLLVIDESGNPATSIG